MRTNIEINDGLLREAMDVLGAKTKRAAVEEALRRVLGEERREQAIQDMKGLGWEGDLDAMREGRDPE